MSAVVHRREFSNITEVVAVWSNIRQLLRAGSEGRLVPVVIPKDRRRYGWIFLLGLALYLFGVAIFSGNGVIAAFVGSARAGRAGDALVLARRDRRDRAGDDRDLLVLRPDHRHAVARPPLFLVALAEG